MSSVLRKSSTSTSPIRPRVYWPRTEFCSASASLCNWIAVTTSAFSERTACAAQRAGGVVEAAAVADPELLLHRDLHVIDVIAVPDRLEHAVREAQHENVLD